MLNAVQNSLPTNSSPNKTGSNVGVLTKVFAAITANVEDVGKLAEEVCTNDCQIDAHGGSADVLVNKVFNGPLGLVELLSILNKFEFINVETQFTPSTNGDVFVEFSYIPKLKSSGIEGKLITDMHKWSFRDGKVCHCKIVWGNASGLHALSQPPIDSQKVIVGKSYLGGAVEWPLVVVSCYTKFSNLAHGPRGTEATQSAWTFRINPSNGTLTLLAANVDDNTMNPAFSRLHPHKNIVYAATESVEDNGQIVTWEICPKSGQLKKIGSTNAMGTSTCYITLDRSGKNALVVNYWNATIVTLAVDEEGRIGEARCVYDPNEGRKMAVKAGQHVNHSKNDKSAQAQRQLDPHSHSVILDPFFGKIAFVPDLGMDLVRQLLFDEKTGSLTPVGVVKSGTPGKVALGPRYIEFHPTMPVAYVINELSSEVAVFRFDKDAALRVAETCCAEPVLHLVQMISSVPAGFPQSMNTCGRITVHSSGRFVLVSNRGHDSIAVFTVDLQGLLQVASIQHTRGATPRHFQFDSSGQWLIAANQDSDKISVFKFCLCTGELVYTGHDYHVPSPNFVCFVDPR